MSYTYQGKTISIARHAEITAAFRPRMDAPFSDDTQIALNEIESWDGSETLIHTFELSHSIGARAVALANQEEPVWGINPHHKAKKPSLSPYISLPVSDSRTRTDIATVELVGTPQQPILTRLYPGDYLPPLPWMKSVKEAPGGRAGSLEYWRSHAYIYRQTVGPTALTTESPDWYKGE